ILRSIIRRISPAIKESDVYRLASLALVLTLTAPLAAQGPAPWSERLAIAEQYRIDAMPERRFTHTEFWAAIAPSLKSERLRAADVGRSMLQRELRTITCGNGPVKVLLWSQMHGDEATASMALADIFNFLAAAPPSPLRDRLA